MRGLALVVFWLAAALIGYTYVGYPALLALLSRWAPPHRKREITPTVDVLIAAYNEEAHIAAKIENTLALDYPRERLRLLVITDGSTDATPELVKRYAGQGVLLLHQPERRGKAAALARGLAHAEGEALLFTDANCFLPRQALRAMVRHLADSRVGGVSGAKSIQREGSGEGESLYWRYEAWLKALESRCGSVMGAPGEAWLARREAYRAAPEDILLEDFYASVEMAARGWRVVYEPEAVSWEKASPSLQAEWRRRVRNAAGAWQAMVRLRVRHGGARFFFQYLSHRVLRWAVVPWLWPFLFAANMLLWPQHPFYGVMLGLQGALYAAALVGWVRALNKRPLGWLAAPLALVMLNAAAVVGCVRFLVGRYSVRWEKVRP